MEFSIAHAFIRPGAILTWILTRSVKPKAIQGTLVCVLNWLDTILAHSLIPSIHAHMLTHTCKWHSWPPFEKSPIFCIFHPYVCWASLLLSPSIVVILQYLIKHYCPWVMSFQDWVWDRVTLVLYVYNLPIIRNVSTCNNLIGIIQFKCCKQLINFRDSRWGEGEQIIPLHLVMFSVFFLWPLLLTRFNFNPSMDR